MSSPLLTTKLYIPRQRSSQRLVPRPRLMARLTEALDNKLTLISAVAGSGKTTLVGDWLRQSERPAAWLSLEEADNDPVRFWTYVIAALQTIQPQVGQTALVALQAPAYGTLNSLPSFEHLLTNLINDLTTLCEPIILVLDDYHLIQTAEIHQSLNFLLDHLSPQLHLVIISREDPPLPLPRLRVRRQMSELRARELHFTTAEAAQFLTQTMKLNLRAEDIAALEQRTEGWVAGLQMAALSIQHLDDPIPFIQAFTGDDHYVVDYLVSEVLDRQPAPMQQFLLQTAILQHLTAPLCDAVTGQENGREALAYLEQANLFLIVLDQQREWYRYHHLFRDLLHHRLRQEVKDAEIKQLHQRAAAWYTQQGLLDEAIQHALLAEDINRAADLIETTGLKLVGQGQLSKILAWLDKLPDELVRTRPRLCLCQAWAFTLSGQFAASEARLQQAEQAAPALGSDLRAQVTTLRAYLARHHSDIPLSIEYLRRALQDCAPDDAFTRTVININLGFNYWLTGQLDLAGQALQATRTEAKAVGAVYALLVALAGQADVCLAQGKLHEAAHLYEEAIAYSLTHNGGQPFPPAGYAYAGLGGLLYEQNELDAATGHLIRAVELGELLGDGTITRRGIFTLVLLKQSAGDMVGVESLWRRAEAAQDTVEAAHVEVQQVRSWLVQAAHSPQAAGLTQAINWADGYRRSQPDPGSYREALAQITLAWVELAQGQTQPALARLELVTTVVTAAGHVHYMIKILALRALAYAAQEQSGMALMALKHALELAAPEGYIRTFVDHGLPMQQLLQQAARQAIAPTYVSKLLAALAAGEAVATDNLAEETPVVSSQVIGATLVEPLNDHEMAVLRLLAAGLSNQEIADQLYLSLNTVKWYVRHIFSKLTVNKRTQAVARAQELGLL